ncbi:MULTISPECIES: mechanosensitive ion channel family protein [unclassified Clostridioides]|uniref:mechanosensitive ion channel family protein n=1 Tax=unclassified Clostridioides TaxID=2635829 RepID=UPI001D114773|nr:mechanosensitive ion channel [Clostridioides sp. ZZV14-6150]MCC0662370.1 mechanosensitive ion channel [Clostridioides sp. ZZV14-6154]MCC0670327.1 mechanosensitive ion channel [Clostridioides sp. ZZV14-6153]MCC0720669.1 mechanosensitive ion channel [Clostridioides sp. ZZV14-6105]MCC0724657.1 mechanosensitive ion channel [Clostridioides sp. ZZV14-6104]MCC0728878.1 mechanosensitive ion channel [Clostridioides sp. ZZV14-6045]MCC0732894.1 mechanosensitive ion channel [Clostridioides sp. ZZV14-6
MNFLSLAKTTSTNSNITKRTLENMLNNFSDNIPNIIYAITIFIIGIYIAKIVRKMVSKFLIKYGMSKGVNNFIVYGIYISMLSIISLISLGIIGIQTTSVVAVLGAAGFSIGLAFKEILSNLGSGMIILFFKPFNIGDYIQGSGVEGTVSDIQIFSTVLKTPDNKTIIIPNFQLTSNNIINYTHQNKRRIDFSYNISYDSDIDMVKSILNEIFTNEKRILDDPKPIIGLNSIGNNTMQIVARPWVKTDDYWDVYFDVMEKVKKKFDENKIEVPFIPASLLFSNTSNLNSLDKR